MTDEEFVRENWIESVMPFHLRTYEASRTYEVRVGGKVFSPKPKNPTSAWAAAANFTREQLEQIQQIEEEIAWLTEHEAFYSGPEIRDRIVAREESVLIKLRQGMKQNASNPTKETP